MRGKKMVKKKTKKYSHGGMAGGKDVVKRYGGEGRKIMQARGGGAATKGTNFSEAV